MTDTLEFTYIESILDEDLSCGNPECSNLAEWLVWFLPCRCEELALCTVCKDKFVKNTVRDSGKFGCYTCGKLVFDPGFRAI